MPELDHLIFAARDIADGIARIEAHTGVQAMRGGPHVGLGTHNALLTFDARTYFEIIAIDPDQPEPPHSRPFGLDRIEAPVLAGYAIHPTGDETMADVVELMKAAGFDPGPVAGMSRERPDGRLISWQLTRGGDRAEHSDGLDVVLPFAIDWGDEPSPAVSLPSMGSLVELTVSHSDPTVLAMVSALDLGITVTEGPVGLQATVAPSAGSENDPETATVLIA